VSKWIRTGARMTVREHSVDLQRPGDAMSYACVKVAWPLELAIHCCAWERGGEWVWSIVRAGKVIDKGSCGNEAGARSAVRRRLKKLVEETRQLPQVAALEAKAVGERTHGEWQANGDISF
jgi:hypothetical protein